MSALPETELRFERLRHEHIDALMVIEEEAYPDPWTRGMLVDEVNGKKSYFYVGFLGEVLAVYGGFWLVLDEAHITSVTVARAFRGQGYGRTLTEYLLKEAVSAGATIATLEVRTTNLPARNLYLSLGFHPVGIRKNYYAKSHEDAMVMIKEM